MTHLEAALAYAAQGIPVFPLAPLEKKPMLAGGAGFKDATTDPYLIQQWWGTRPDANIGVPNGLASGTWVLDIDPRNDANNAWDKFVERYGEPLTRTIRTGSGGKHYVFKLDGRTIRRCKTSYPGIEICGEGGYTVVPPSRTTTGLYELINDMPPEFEEAWITQHFLSASRTTLKVPPGQVVPEGQRDVYLHRVASGCRGEGMAEDEILRRLEEVNTRCVPPLEMRDLARIARSASKYPPGTKANAFQLPTTGHPDPIKELATPQPYTALDLWDAQANGIPPLDWLIPGWLVYKDVCIIGGDAGAGKSTTAAALAHALASGHNWLGIQPSRRVPVLYFDEEQGDEMVARLFLQSGGPVAGLNVFSGAGINLSDASCVARLEATIRDCVVPPVVFLDTVQQTFGVDDANNATKVGAIYGTLFRLRDLTGATFVLLHHISKPPQAEPNARLAIHRLRDSSAHATQASTVWFLQSAAENVTDLFHVKRRGAAKQSMRITYSLEFDEIKLSAEDVETAVSDSDRLAEAVSSLIHSVHHVRRPELESLRQSMGLSKALLDGVLKRLIRERSIYKLSRGVYAAQLSNVTSSFFPEQEEG